MTNQPSTYTYKSVAGCLIHADVYRARSGLGPAILWLHGGMLMAGGRADLPAWQLQRYQKAGFTIVSADYRLAPETRLKDIISDVQDAYAWMRGAVGQEFGIDPGRIAVIGHSAGGYLTLLAGHHLHPRPRALVAFYGYSDIDGDWYSRPDPFYCQLPPVSKEEAYAVKSNRVISETNAPDVSQNRGRFYLYCRQNGLWPNEVAGFDPRREPRAFDPFCPIRNVSADNPPTLLVHGALDTDVPHEQSAQMARELARQDVAHEFISLPDHGHAFDIQEENQRDPAVAAAFERTIAFLNAHTGPQ